MARTILYTSHIVKAVKRVKGDSETTLIDISWCISQSVNQALDEFSKRKEIRDLNGRMGKRDQSDSESRLFGGDPGPSPSPSASPSSVDLPLLSSGDRCWSALDETTIAGVEGGCEPVSSSVEGGDTGSLRDGNPEEVISPLSLLPLVGPLRRLMRRFRRSSSALSRRLRERSPSSVLSRSPWSMLAARSATSPPSCDSGLPPFSS